MQKTSACNKNNFKITFKINIEKGYTLSEHYLIFTHMKFGNTKPSVADHNTLKFRDMKNFDMESFSNDLSSCDILNGSQDNDDITWEMWKLAYTDICDKHVPMKSLRLKKWSNPWMTHDIKSLCMSATMYTPRLHKSMIQNYGKITVIYGIKQRVLSRSERIYSYTLHKWPLKCGRK